MGWDDVWRGLAAVGGLGQAADCSCVSLSPARSPHTFSSSCAVLPTASTPSLSCGSLMTPSPWPSSSSPSTSSWRSAGPGAASSSGEGLGQGGGCCPGCTACVSEVGPGNKAVLAPGAAWAPAAVTQISAQPGCVREDEHPALRTWASLPPPPAVWAFGLYPQALHLCPAPGGSLLAWATGAGWGGGGSGLPCLDHSILPGRSGGWRLWGGYMVAPASELAPRSQLGVDR